MTQDNKWVGLHQMHQDTTVAIFSGARPEGCAQVCFPCPNNGTIIVLLYSPKEGVSPCSYKGSTFGFRRAM